MIQVTIGSPNLDIADQWTALTGRAAANAFMSPAALRAASDTRFADVHLLLAWDASNEPRRLVGLWALQKRRALPFLPMSLDALPFYYAFSSTPVIDPAVMDEVAAAFLGAIADDAALPKVISIKRLDADSEACRAIVRALTARGDRQLVLAETVRPFVTRECGIKNSGSTRKKLRQDWNRLSALGQVDVVNERDPAAVRDAFEVFLALENAGWKGEQGTSLLSTAADAAFVRRMVGNLADQQSASVALLRLDGRAVAAQVLMYCGSTAYTWKTAFDETHGKYSPGALLIDKVTELVFAMPQMQAIDSCSAESSFMSNLWTGRRNMVDILIDVGATGSVGFRLEVMRERGYQLLRGWRDRLRAARAVQRPRKTAVPVPQ